MNQLLFAGKCFLPGDVAKLTIECGRTVDVIVKSLAMTGGSEEWLGKLDPIVARLDYEDGTTPCVIFAASTISRDNMDFALFVIRDPSGMELCVVQKT